MSVYQVISAAGLDMGTYAGASVEDAIEALHRDAGYESSQAAADALDTTVADLAAELTVVRYDR